VAFCFCFTLTISSSKIENDQTPEKINQGTKEQEGEEEIVELDLLHPCSLFTFLIFKSFLLLLLLLLLVLVFFLLVVAIFRSFSKLSLPSFN
jgi:hypothetical protein